MCMRLFTGDLATQFFADRNIFCAGRVEDADLLRAAKATGAKIQTTVYGLTPDVLGAFLLHFKILLRLSASGCDNM